MKGWDDDSGIEGHWSRTGRCGPGLGREAWRARRKWLRENNMGSSRGRSKA